MEQLIPLLNSLFPGMTGIDWEGVSETIKPASFSLSITGGLLMSLRKFLILSSTVLAVSLASASSSQHSVIVVINASNCYKTIMSIIFHATKTSYKNNMCINKISAF